MCAQMSKEREKYNLGCLPEEGPLIFQCVVLDVLLLVWWSLLTSYGPRTGSTHQSDACAFGKRWWWPVRGAKRRYVFEESRTNVSFFNSIRSATARQSRVLVGLNRNRLR
ncbi:hypothetical protein L596_001442 [Steinernema carpocapsae]|uniref:Uncharacterized protein n=1 Tax=Steinernema carpocapsae TaxID=34508 RepID=A0A4U8UMA5_STECR|nr:hypothetical protein L596_001442 [Steinernema carpocapsae]